MEFIEINKKTESIMGQVAGVVEKLHTRVEKVDFGVEVLPESSINDLRLHLGYTKNYSDLAKVRLMYQKIGNQ